MSAVKLDGSGNIESVSLERSLQSALDFDVKYRQTDNMKKRAIRVAGSYDEFKAMVSCAHLKTVSRKDIESLRYTRKEGKDISLLNKVDTSASILADEVKSIDSKTFVSSTTLKGTAGLPKNPMALNRDLRRLVSLDEKLRYLQNIGLKKLKKLLLHESDPELFETVVSLLLEFDVADSVEWLSTLTSIDNFSLMVSFLCSTTVEKIKAISSDESNSVNVDVLKKYLQ